MTGARMLVVLFLGADAAGRMYAVLPKCSAPGRALRLLRTFDVELEIQIGICPFAIAFAHVAAGT